MRAEDGARPAGRGPDPVGQQRHRQLGRGQPRAATPAGRDPEPAQRDAALRGAQAGQQVNGGAAAVTLGRGV
jgi:hypothetical protein